jgi:5-methylphenazine-1-carboxylate 1-monooxygenase
VLWQAAETRLAGALRPGHRLAGYVQDAGGVTARFARADGGLVEERGDALIGADGIHSVLRGLLHPADGGIRWQGIQMWRGALDWPVFEGGDGMVIAGDMAEKLVLYPIGPGSTPGTRLTNWVVCARLGDGTQPPPRREDWSRAGRLADVLPHVRRFRIPFLEVEAMVRATPQFFEYPMCDRDPLPWWTQGRVTLLGDAAHPMYPQGGNGGAQAIIDAATLARLLASETDTVAALKAYEAARLPATSRIVLQNRTAPPNVIVDTVEQRTGGRRFERLDDIISQDELKAIFERYQKVAGYHVNQVSAVQAGNS